MARWLKQNTSVDVPIGPFLDATDGVTPEGSLTITQPDIRLKKNGGAWAQKNAAQTLSHEENGNYEVTLDATDTNTLGLLRLHVAESGALPVFEDFIVVPGPIYDWLIAGSATLDVNAASLSNNALTAAAIASNAITDAKIATGAFTAAKFASGAFDAVWSVTARTLSSISALAGEIRTALGLSSANLDTQLSSLSSGQTTINNNVLAVAARLIALAITSGAVAADAGNTATTFKTNLTETSNEHWKESFILITSGTLIGAARKIDGYNGSTKFITVSPAFPSTPANSVTFTIINR